MTHDVIHKVTNQIIDLAKQEKVPNVLILILQTVNEFQKIINDDQLKKNAKDLYTSLLQHSDSDVSFYAERFSKES